MRAVFRIPNEPAAMKRSTGPDAVRSLCGSDHGHGAAHAIACCSDLARCIDGALSVEPIDKGVGVSAVGCLRQGPGIGNNFFAHTWIAKGLPDLH